MKKIFTLIGLVAISANASFAQDDIMSFLSQSAIGSEGVEFSNAIEYDADGNLYIYGEFSDDMDADPTSGELMLDPLGQPDLYVSKYNSTGEPIWAFGLGRVGLNDGMNVGDIQVDPDGNVYICGSFSSFVDFDPSEGVNLLTSNGGQDAFVAKYSQDGEFIWAQQYGTSGTELSTSAALDGSGGLTFSLRFSNELDIDLGVDEVLLTPVGGADAAVIKIDLDGLYVWSHQIGTADTDEITALAYDANGALAIGSIINGVNNPFPVQDMMLTMVANDGVVSWEHNFDNLEQNNAISSFAFDATNEHVYIGGRIQGVTDFDPSEGEAIVDPLFTDPFFAKYNLTTGDLAWANTIESSGIEDYVSGMVESGGALFVMGSFDVVAKFDINDFASQIPSNGAMDMYLAAYDNETGAYIMANTAGGVGSERAVDSDFDAANGIAYVTGAFSTSLQLDEDSEAIPSNGFADIFFAEFEYETALSAYDYIDLDNAFSVFPVPASDELQVAWNIPLLSGNLDFVITNVVGQEVKTVRTKSTANKASIDLDNLKPGIYILTIKSNGGVATERFVKN